MHRSYQTVIVLWGKNFDEAAASIFVTELRKAGLSVKIVGIGGRQLNGAHGLALIPDWTLDNAIAHFARVICIIGPCQVTQLRRLYDDPRLPKLIQLTHKHILRMVVGQLDYPSLPDEEISSPLAMREMSEAKLTVYPASEHLLLFVRELAEMITGHVRCISRPLAKLE